MESIKLKTNPEAVKNFEKMTFDVPRFPHLEYVINSTERNEKMIFLKKFTR